MNIKDMPHVTVGQVLALRAAAIELEEELAITKQARTAYRISLENLEASIPKIKADAVSNYLEYLEYCKKVSIDNPTKPLEYLTGINKLEAGE